MISKQADFENGRIITITDIGSNNRAMFLPNQDSCGYRIMDNDYCIAVADGVGSCKYADVGAQKAVDICLDLFTEIKNRQIPFSKKTIIDCVIFRWKEAFGEEAENYCSTLKTIIKIENEMLLVSIGDGVLAVSSDGVNVIAPVESVDFVNETYCLSNSVKECDFWSNTFSLDLHKPYAALCCTDGIANGLIQGSQIDVITSIEKEICIDDLKSELENFVTDIAKYSFDDKTIGVVKYEG